MGTGVGVAVGVAVGVGVGLGVCVGVAVGVGVGVKVAVGVAVGDGVCVGVAVGVGVGVGGEIRRTMGARKATPARIRPAIRTMPMMSFERDDIYSPCAWPERTASRGQSVPQDGDSGKEGGLAQHLTPDGNWLELPNVKSESHQAYMPRTIRLAAVQMDASPAPTAARLARASRLVAAAAEAGAHLVALPELFNTGYAYAYANFRLAEPPDGLTTAWMKETAARLNVHLAGSLMVLGRGEIVNRLLLFAPDGRTWHYDKNHPWGWERAYFRPGHGVTVAETDLGHVGLMVCWDVAHPRLWNRYAGRVDLMIITSCPPDIGNPTFHFSSGNALTFDDMGPAMASLKGAGESVFGDMINEQAGWLGVPAVNTVGSGHVRTTIPNSLGTFLAFLPVAPWLVKYLPQAGRMEMACQLVQGCKVVNADGRVLAELTQAQGETFTVAEVTLASERPSPRGPQPPSRISWFATFISDVLLPSLAIPVYRRGLRRLLKERAAAVSR